MNTEGYFNISLFKTVTQAIARSEDLESMSDHLVQLLTAALDIKGCAIFVLNPQNRELDILASFGLSTEYLMKGPVRAPQSMAATFEGEMVVIADVSKDSTLQYPEEARREGIAAIISIPIAFSGEVLGALRLYHQETWNPSREDLDSLRLLSETIGLAMSYSKLRNAMNHIAEIMLDTFSGAELEGMKGGRVL